MGLPRFAVVDLETSGLRPRRDNVLQIGLVTVEIDSGGRAEIIDRWSTLIHLRWPWSRVGPKRIHGISRRALRSAPRADAALAELTRRIDCAVFTAHNARFDAAFLRRLAKRVGVPLDLGSRLCTLDLSRRLDPDRTEPHGLAELCGRYGVDLINHHDALADADATAAVLPHLLRAHDVTDPTDLDALYL